MKRFFLLAFLLPAVLIAEDHDLVIYGGTPAGIAAGVTAAREGASVVIIEPTRWIGGLVTGGLTRSDIGKRETVGGFAQEFFDRASQGYPPEFLYYAEPQANMRAFEALLAEAKIKVLRGQRLQSVVKEGARLRSLTTTEGVTFTGRQFIDASYEGDLMAQAGVGYRVGREARDEYNEPLAGFYPMEVRERDNDTMATACKCVGGHGPHYIHGTPAKIPALDEKGGLIFGVTRADPKLKPGDADGLTQAYNFRVVVTQREDIRVPFPKPENYDPARYELLLRLIQAYPKVAFGRIFHLGETANGKFDLNAQGLFSTDYPGGNTGYPDGDAATRERIWQDHQDFIQGMLWFLGNDERVPAELRAETNTWGLCRDEFTDNENWPYALYIREGRRMVGEYVMNQHDCQRSIRKPDTVGMGSFVIDCHIVQRIVTADGHVTDEGSFPDAPARPYQIPYRSLTPKRAECENLLVPVCFSASHIAYCSMRMEPVYMAMGHASGLAATMALKSEVPVQAIEVAALQEKLRAQKAVLALDVADLVFADSLPGIVVDDAQADFTGSWTHSNYGNPIEGNASHDGGTGQGQKSARFTVAVPKAGRYEVRLAYSAAPNRASNAPVRVTHANGIAEMTVNQKQAPAGDAHFHALGTWLFKPDAPVIIEISNENADGIVSVDAVQLLPAKE